MWETSTYQNVYRIYSIFYIDSLANDWVLPLAFLLDRSERNDKIQLLLIALYLYLQTIGSGYSHLYLHRWSHFSALGWSGVSVHNVICLYTKFTMWSVCTLRGETAERQGSPGFSKSPPPGFQGSPPPWTPLWMLLCSTLHQNIYLFS